MTEAVQPPFQTTGRGPNWGAPDTRVGSGGGTPVLYVRINGAAVQVQGVVKAT